MILTKLNKSVSLQVSDSELEQARKAISDIKLTNKQLQSAFGPLVNSQIEESFANIEKSLSHISRVLEKPSIANPITNQSTENASSYTMKQHSLQKVLQMAMPRHLPKTIKITFPSNDIKIYGHMYKLIVLFSSLLENSIQAMKNSGSISINAAAMGSKTRIEIQDSGPGIPDEVLDKLFSSLATTKKHGSGLGTKMAKSIVDLHKGTISVKNNPTTFVIELPFQ